MKHSTGGFILQIVLLTGLASPGWAQANTAGQARFLTTGSVAKIDLKQKTIDLSQAFSMDRGEDSKDPKANSAALNEIGRLATVQSNFKAKITDKTVFKDKETGKAISLADLMVGDMVQVSSAKGGNKLDAVEVVRLPKPLGPRK